MDISSVIKQDIGAVYSAFKNEDFRNMNIFSNRIMSNALFSDDPKFTLIGFFLKDIALIYDAMKARKELATFTTAKSFGEVFLKSLKIEDEIDEHWKKYHEFCNSVREHTATIHEKKSYKEAIEFSHASFIWLLKLLEKDKELLLVGKNQFARGILNEMNRIFRVHGGGIEEIYAVSLIRGLQLYYEYMDYFEDARTEIITSSVFPYVDAIAKTMMAKEVNQKEVTSLLRRIIIDWRLSYIRFMERPRIVPIGQKPLPITEETRQKLSETIAKALEEEVK